MNCIHAKIKVKMAVGQTKMKEKSVWDINTGTESRGGEDWDRQARQRLTPRGLCK